jgi:hypothetical protein
LVAGTILIDDDSFPRISLGIFLKRNRAEDGDVYIIDKIDVSLLT